jgi:hypothetical protein
LGGVCHGTSVPERTGQQDPTRSSRRKRDPGSIRRGKDTPKTRGRVAIRLGGKGVPDAEESSQRDRTLPAAIRVTVGRVMVPTEVTEKFDSSAVLLLYHTNDL